MDRPEEGSLRTMAIVASVTLTGAFMIFLGVTISHTPVERGAPLDAQDQFTKAQFCVQTYRTPFVGRYHVTCHDYKHGGDEEAP